MYDDNKQTLEKEQNELKFTNHNQRTWSFKSVQIDFCFLRVWVRSLMTAKLNTVD